MVFLNPWALWTLPLIFLPILIHLFNVRKVKTIYFSDNRFLRKVILQHKQKRTVRYWLILITRTIMVLCIVLAFSKPTFNTSHKNSKTLIIYLDNSLSTGRMVNQGSVLYNLQNQLQQALLQRSSDTRCLLFTNDINSKWLEPVSPLQCSNYIRDVKISSQSISTEQVFKRLQYILQQVSTADVEFWYFSDGQGMHTYKARQLTEPNAQNYFNIINSDVNQNNNVSIDSCWMYSKHLNVQQTDTMYVALSSWTNETLPVSLKISCQGQKWAIKNITLKPNQKNCIPIPLTMTFKGMQCGEITLEGDSYKPDNTFYFCLNTEQHIPVLLISDAIQQNQNMWLHILRSDSLFKLTHLTPSQCNPESINRNHILILNRLTTEHQAFLNSLLSQDLSTKTTIIFPHKQWLKNEQANTFLNQWGLPKMLFYDTALCRISPPEKRTALFKNVFSKWPTLQSMPQLQGHAVCNSNANSTLLKFTQGDPLLIQIQNVHGGIFFYTSDYYESPAGGLPKSLALPLLYEMVFSNRELKPVFYSASQSIRMNTEWNTRAAPHFTHMQTSTLLYPQVYSNLGRKQLYFAKDQVLPGFYQCNTIPNSGFAVNSSRSESNPKGLQSDELKQWIETQDFKHSYLWEANYISSISSGAYIPIWKFLVILALLCLVVESFLLRQLTN